MGASYRAAIKWVAENDEPAENDLGVIGEATTTRLLGHLFDTATAEVARDVLSARQGKRTKCGVQKGCTLRKDHKGECRNEWGDEIKPAEPVEASP